MCVLLEDVCTKIGQPVEELLQEKHPDIRVPPPVENLTIAYFNEYEELQETVLLDLS